MSEWQTETTDAVARVLYQAGVALSPDAVATNLDAVFDEAPDETAVREALTTLREESLARRLDREGDYYVITDYGRDYVETEIDQEGVGFIE
ncbi:MAG: hypothetical protein ABEJ68_03670 [Halobacteriaceae archaeon]